MKNTSKMATKSSATGNLYRARMNLNWWWFCVWKIKIWNSNTKTSYFVNVQISVKTYENAFSWHTCSCGMWCHIMLFAFYFRQRRKERKQERRLQRQNHQEDRGDAQSSRKRLRREVTPSSARLIVDCSFDNLMLMKVQSIQLCVETICNFCEKQRKLREIRLLKLQTRFCFYFYCFKIFC